MASFEVIGFINNIKYLQDSVMVFVDEFRKGYRKSDGTIVDDRYFSWKILYKGYFKKYINGHFNEKMLVKVKGEVLPYAIEQGECVDGYSVIGETINLFSYPRATAKLEQQMLKESAMLMDEKPDIEGFHQPDF